MADLMESLRGVVEERIPHNRWLGIRLASADEEHATCVVRRAETPVGSLLATLIDVASGAAVCMKLRRLQPMATAGLRVDFLREPRPGHLLIARAQCYKVVGSTAFVRAFAYDDDSADPVAAGQGTFLLAGGSA